MSAPKPKNREPDHLDAWGAYFSPRRPLIQWVCAMSDAQASALMRRLGLSEPRPSEMGDGPMTLWELNCRVNTDAPCAAGTDMPEKTPAEVAGVGAEGRGA